MPTAPQSLVRPIGWTRAEKVLLAVVGGVVFLDTLDLSLVQVALPSIGSALRLPDGQLQWIVSAFVLGYGGFLLFGGRSADVSAASAYSSGAWSRSSLPRSSAPSRPTAPC